MLAKEVMDLIQSRVDTPKYLEMYNEVHNFAEQNRTERKQKKALEVRFNYFYSVLNILECDKSRASGKAEDIKE